MNWSNLIGSVLSAAKMIVPLVVPGAGTAVVEAATAIAGAVHEVAALPGLTDAQAGELAVTRETLEAAVNAHADRTAASLGDG